MITIAHAAALTDEDRVPFEHGVALARSSGARFYSVHADRDPAAAAKMLDAADVLARWGGGDVGVDFRKVVHDCCADPVESVLDALREIAPDLVIAATHQREGLMRMLLGSRAEAISTNVRVPTLLMPIGADGFVSPTDGAIDLTRILVPVGDREAGQIAADRAAWLAALGGADDVEVTLLHVGPERTRPTLVVPERAGLRFVYESSEHVSLEDAILEAAKSARLIVMASRGHDSIGDVMRGSHTDRVLHRARCAVLSVPVPP
jgi:nucleotide-binding universal stress UspA family protein